MRIELDGTRISSRARGKRRLEKKECFRLRLRMIGLVAKEGVEKWFACGLVAPAPRLDGDEDGIDLGQLLGIVEPHDPAAVGFVVHIKNTQIHW